MDFKQLLSETILPDVRERWIPEMEIFYDRPAWEPGLNDLLPCELHPHAALFNSYRLARPQAHQGITLAPGFTLSPVDRFLLSQHGLGHMEHLTGWILSFYHSVDDFLQTGFGYVTIAESDQAIASLCISVFVAASATGPGQDAELGLATAPEYRGRGLASAVAAACVRRCLENGSSPVWHCWADNAPSASVAVKVGYELLHQTPAIRFDTGLQAQVSPDKME